MGLLYLGRSSLGVSLLVLASVFSMPASAAQRGPIFPTHHYPTDRSFHLGYDFGWLTSADNFVSALRTEPLDQNSRLRIFRHTFSAEFQPNRQASIGINFNIDSMSLTSPKATAAQTKTGLSDQSLFAEYRFFDEPGKSLGGAVVAKFPLYGNPSLQEVSNGDGSVVLLGDAQTDLTFMFTSEYWLGNIVRTQLDAGYTFRTEKFSAELPYQFSVGIVTPKMDLTLRVKGNMSLGSSVQDPNSDEIQIQKAFAGSKYALSQSPWTLNLEPSLEVWIKPTWAATFSYTYSIAGNNAPTFQNFMIGARYRFAERVATAKRTFKQIDIHTDQEEGKFQGEEQNQGSEPRVRNPRPIQQPGDEVFR